MLLTKADPYLYIHTDAHIRYTHTYTHVQTLRFVGSLKL